MLKIITSGYWYVSQVATLYFGAYFLFRTVAKAMHCTPKNANVPPSNISPSFNKPVSPVINKYRIPINPTIMAIYLTLEIFSSFKSIFNQSAVNTGAELISMVTSPEEIYCKA